MPICLLYIDNTLDSAKLTLQEWSHDFPLADSFFQISTRPLTLHVVYYSKPRPESQRMAEKISSKLCFWSRQWQVRGWTRARRGEESRRSDRSHYSFRFITFFLLQISGQTSWTACFLHLQCHFLCFFCFCDTLPLSRWGLGLGLVSSEYKSSD